MKSWIAWVIVLAAIAAAAGGGYLLGHRGASSAKNKDDEASAESSKSEDKPLATVSVVPIGRGTISQSVTGYGTVVAPPSEVQVVSVPFECRAMKILVTPGQIVAVGQALIQVEGSAATALAYEEARNAAAAAERDLQLAKQRYEQKLATNADLYAAENAFKTAQARLQNLQHGGAGEPRQLKSEMGGIVSKVDVQLGQIVPAGSPLVEVVAQNRIEVQLGVEPQDAAYLKPGQPVQLNGIEGATGETLNGQIRMVAQRVDPTNHLVDVMVSLPTGSKFMLDMFVAGQMIRESAEALIVPRDAVLPAEDGGYTLFTVKDGHAVKHAVRVGIQNAQDVQVIAEDVKEGDPAVVVGNFELDDGMAVRVQAMNTPPPTTEAATTNPTTTSPATGPGESK